METVNIIVLALSGLLLSMVGLMRLTNPIQAYSKNSGIKLNNEIDLLNEVRGVSSLMLCAGISILLGTVLSEMTMISLIVATLIFIGFAIGRLVSIGMDGKPNKQIVQGLMSELILGAANVFCLVTMLL